MNLQPDPNDVCTPSARRLRRPGDLRRVLFGLLLLTLMVATHARGEDRPLSSFDTTVAAYDDLLQKYVDADGLVDYVGLAGNRHAREILSFTQDESLVSDLSEFDGDVALAAKINAYNAEVLELLLEAGAGTAAFPSNVLSIDDGKLFDIPRVRIPPERRTMSSTRLISLNQLEKEHIAPLAGDARYHFAINCGALSCPPLRAEAYTDEKLQEQLDDQRARTLDRGDDRFLVWKGNGAVEVSRIFDWYGDEFGDVAAYLNEHAGLPGEVTKVAFLEYDWSLNAQ